MQEGRDSLVFKWSYVLLVFVSGGMGAAVRYLATTMIGARLGSTFPFGTLAVNVAGSFLMGFLMAFAIWQHTTLPEPVRLICAVGFLGGFTTFSSFSMETMTLLFGGQIGLVLLNVAANCLAGFAACWLGIKLAMLYS